MIKAGYVQFQPSFGEKENNLRKIGQLLRSAPDADLLVLPELAATGYNFAGREETASLAEPFGEGPTSDLLLAIAAERQITLVAGYAESAREKLYNSCILVRPDGALFNYRKVHLFSREKQCFDPGDAPPPVIETPAGQIGMMICFDWIFPEVARLLALGGAEIIAHPSNLVLSYCQRAMFARCVENRLFAITANRIGEEDRAGRRLVFTGASQVLDFHGNVLVSASPDQEEIGIAEMNPSEARSKQINEVNNLIGDRRTELYGDLLSGSVPPWSR